MEDAVRAFIDTVAGEHLPARRRWRLCRAARSPRRAQGGGRMPVHHQPRQCRPRRARERHRRVLPHRHCGHLRAPGSRVERRETDSVDPAGRFGPRRSSPRRRHSTHVERRVEDCSCAPPCRNGRAPRGLHDRHSGQRRSSRTTFRRARSTGISWSLCCWRSPSSARLSA